MDQGAADYTREKGREAQRSGSQEQTAYPPVVREVRGAPHALEFSAHGFGLVLLPRSASRVSRTGVVFNLKTSVDAILGPSSRGYDCTNDCSAMHRIGEIPNNCKCLWIQLGAELAGVQLLFLGSNISLTARSGSRPKSSCGRTRDTELSRASSVISLPCCSHAKQISSIPESGMSFGYSAPLEYPSA